MARKATLRWDIEAGRWTRPRKAWYPDNFARSRAWTQLMARVGAVRSAAGPWHPVWQPDDERLPTIAERQAMATQAEAVEYALEEIAQSYADHYAGDLDLRVTRFAPSELEGLQRFDDPDARGPRRRYYLA